VIQGRWKLSILCELSDGRQRALDGGSQNVLKALLRALEVDGVELLPVLDDRHAWEECLAASNAPSLSNDGVQDLSVMTPRVTTAPGI